MMSEFVQILTTVDDDSLARVIALALVQKRLAACVQRVPIESVYVWDNELCESAEIQLAIKTHRNCIDAVSLLLREYCSYTTMQIVVLPIVGGNDDYFTWLRANVDWER